MPPGEPCQRPERTSNQHRPSLTALPATANHTQNQHPPNQHPSPPEPTGTRKTARVTPPNRGAPQTSAAHPSAPPAPPAAHQSAQMEPFPGRRLRSAQAPAQTGGPASERAGVWVCGVGGWVGCLGWVGEQSSCTSRRSCRQAGRRAGGRAGGQV